MELIIKLSTFSLFSNFTIRENTFFYIILKSEEGGKRGEGFKYLCNRYINSSIYALQNLELVFKVYHVAEVLGWGSRIRFLFCKQMANVVLIGIIVKSQCEI